MNDQENILLLTDFYKHTHWCQTPRNTNRVYSYSESRGGVDWLEWFGLQPQVKRHLVGKVITREKIDEAAEIVAEMSGYKEYFNRAGFEYILNKYDGRLPVRIRALPEGIIVPPHVAVSTIENTDDNCPFMSNFLESVLLQPQWYGSSVATVSRNVKKIIKKWAQVCGSDVNDFHLNDFGFRGASSIETASLGGMAHLTNFRGTDTVNAVRWAKKYYGASGFIGASVKASEHSTTTIYGKEGEALAIQKFIEDAPDAAIVSVVADSYNTYHFCRHIIGVLLKDIILKRKGKVVVRPDSGDPIVMSHAVVDMLWEKFGGTTNAKGYRILDPHVGVIYGDGINPVSIDKILENLVKHGYSTDNIVFGMGGKLLQDVNRDTQKWATKCSWAQIGEHAVDVFKDPVTDTGKRSKKGRLKTIRLDDGTITTVPESHPGVDLMETVFENGNLVREWTWNEVLKNAAL
jgi:nicotinamide phosphoribosyltransferase